MNKALGAKLIWAIYENPQLYWVRVLKGKYLEFDEELEEKSDLVFVQGLKEDNLLLKITKIEELFLLSDGVINFLWNFSMMLFQQGLLGVTSDKGRAR